MSAYVLRKLKVPYKWEKVHEFTGKKNFIASVVGGEFEGISLCSTIIAKGDTKRILEELAQHKFVFPKLVHVHEQDQVAHKKLLIRVRRCIKATGNKSKNVRILSWNTFAQKE